MLVKKLMKIFWKSKYLFFKIKINKKSLRYKLKEGEAILARDEHIPL